MAKATLDRSRAFATLISLNPTEKGCFEQDGIIFGANDAEVRRTPTAHRIQKEKDEAPFNQAALEAEQRAAAILGDGFLDPHADVLKENAAAAAAEQVSDDAQVS